MNRTFKLLPIAVLLSSSWAAHAQQLAYAPEMIRALVPEGQDIDISFFEKGYDLAPGRYRFTIYMNGQRKGTGTYEIREKDSGLQPVLRVSDVLSLPLKDEVLAELSNLGRQAEIFPLASKLKDATASVNTKEMRIDISVPQIYLSDNEGWVDVVSPDLWDYGETGAVINYNLTGNHLNSRDSDYEHTNYNLNLSGHLNFGAWRLFSSGSFNAYKSKLAGQNSEGQNWDLWNTYLQRDIPTWKGTLQIGELTTNGEIFESIPIRGFRVSTNEQMLPYRERNYSPIIEGVANSNAQIIIRQNDHIVYTLNVAPGPFRLDNLPSFGNYGDLEVIIREADGSERLITVPLSSVPSMLRVGQYRYDFNVGRYYRKNQNHINNEPIVFMGTLSYGLPKDITLFGGSILSEQYSAFALGSGMSLGKYGALAADVIHSRHESDPERSLDAGNGAAWRIRYEKNLLATGTSVNLANYQYITGNYCTFEDYVTYGTRSYSQIWNQGKLKSRWQLSLSQTLGSYGSLSLGADYSQYRGNSSDTKTFNAGFYTSLKGVGVSLNYSRNYLKVGTIDNRSWDSNHTIMLNVNVPLGVFDGGRLPDVVKDTSVSYMGRMEKAVGGEKYYQQSVVMNGYATDQNLSWTVSQDLGSNEDRATSLSLNYSGDRFTSNFGLGQNHYSNTYQVGLSGSLVMHKTGVTASSRAFDSVAVIEVPDAEGVSVMKSFKTKTDMFGNGIITYLSNYTKNEFAIDPSTLPEGALLLDSSNQVVIPTSAAIVRVKYPVRFGEQAVFVLKNSVGNPLPLGSKVELINSDGLVDPFVSGIVGEGGRVYLTGLPKQGTLKVINNETSRTFSYQLESTEHKNTDGFTNIPSLELISQQ